MLAAVIGTKWSAHLVLWLLPSGMLAAWMALVSLMWNPKLWCSLVSRNPL